MRSFVLPAMAATNVSNGPQGEPVAAAAAAAAAAAPAACVLTQQQGEPDGKGTECKSKKDKKHSERRQEKGRDGERKRDKKHTHKEARQQQQPQQQDEGAVDAARTEDPPAAMLPAVLAGEGVHGRKVERHRHRWVPCFGYKC